MLLVSDTQKMTATNYLDELTSTSHRHVDELITLRRISPEPERTALRETQFRTADGIIYFLQEGTPMLAITRKEDNPLLHGADVLEQLARIGFYRPPLEEVLAAIHAPKTERFDVTKLQGEYIGKDAGEMLFYVPTTAYTKLNPIERAFAERLCGQGADFVANMAMFREMGIGAVPIWLEDPALVLRDTAEGPLVVPCELDLLGVHDDENSAITLHREYVVPKEDTK